MLFYGPPGLGKTTLAQIVARELVARLDNAALTARLRRVAVNEERLRLATAVEQAAEAIVITDANNCIVTVNPAFSYITGYVAEEVIGRDPKLLHSGRHNDAF